MESSEAGASIGRSDYWHRYPPLLESAHFMNRVLKPLQILVYQDVLCAWCYIASLRLETVRHEFGDAVVWKTRPYPLRLNEALPTAKDLKDWCAEIELARREPEGHALSSELWTTGDPPRSSLSALAALEAARLQGPEREHALARALQKAALEQGVNVTRPDVVFELAARQGLNMNRFIAAYEAPATRRLIREEHTLAASRGVKGVPALVINGQWMLSGLKDVAEYREHLLRCMEKVERGGTESDAGRLLH